MDFLFLEFIIHTAYAGKFIKKIGFQTHWAGIDAFTAPDAVALLLSLGLSFGKKQ